MTRTIANLKIYQHPNVMRAIQQKEIYVRLSDNIICQPEPGLNVASPWLFEHTENKPCRWCHKILFSLYALCPSPAFDCWKVVVRPRTVVELVALHELQVKMKVASKCGIEPRPNVPANYGGYFYTRSFEASLDMLDNIRDLVSEKIHVEIPVYLKRGCTGIEEMFGRSDKWKMAEGQDILEAKLEKVFHKSFRELPTLGHPPKLKEEIFESWLDFAHSRGDMTYLEITNGRHCFPPAITYNRDSKCSQW